MVLTNIRVNNQIDIPSNYVKEVQDTIDDLNKLSNKNDK